MGEEPIYSKLANIEIAPGDYVEGGLFTWEEALEIEKNLSDGWRLPTRSEWALIAEEFGQDENGELIAEVLRKKLSLGGCYYWSSTPNNTMMYKVDQRPLPDQQYVLSLESGAHFDIKVVNTRTTISRKIGVSLRLVRDIQRKE